MTREAPYSIVEVSADEAEPLTAHLIALLRDAVASGASLGFWDPLDEALGLDFWRGVYAAMRAGTLRLLVARQADVVVGSAQLSLSPKQNAVRRGEVLKVMTHRDARRQGIGEALMREVERLAYDAGRRLLVLDTNTGTDAERLYRRMGYRELGVIPDYTVGPDDAGHAATFFYKPLETQPDGR
ncbi:MAG: GNAT family N-acetyltransferase [Chloroflexota bacterium]|nr:GNAT family N-acetyltransferase [Chloroflexota bacterium]